MQPILIYGTTSLDGAQQSEVLRYQPITTVPVANDETDFTMFMLPEQTGPANIDTAAHTILIEVTNGTSMIALIPIFTLSAGASVKVGAIDQVSGVTSNDFTAPVTYTVTSEDGTTIQDWEVTVTEDPTGINKIEFMDINVFPNPIKDVLNVSGNEIERIDVYDIVGKMISSYEVNSFNTKIKLSDNPEGILILKIHSKNNIVVKRVVLEK